RTVEFQRTPEYPVGGRGRLRLEPEHQRDPDRRRRRNDRSYFTLAAGAWLVRTQIQLPAWSSSALCGCERWVPELQHTHHFYRDVLEHSERRHEWRVLSRWRNRGIRRMVWFPYRSW